MPGVQGQGHPEYRILTLRKSFDIVRVNLHKLVVNNDFELLC